MEIKKFNVEVELTEPMLGTVPKNKEVYATYIATKTREHAEREARREKKDGVPAKVTSGEEIKDGTVATMEAEEVETVQEIEERGWTGFHSDEKGPFLYDYLIKGNLCEAARALKQYGTLKQLQDKVKRYVFIRPRRIYLPPLSPDPLERPLRAMTAQGPRVTVVRSDLVPAGGVIKYTIHVITAGGVTLGCLEELLGYGEFIGLGQWRTGSYGQFKLNSIEEA